MASKRSSRLFKDEAAYSTEGQQKAQKAVSNGSTSFQSGRSSRSSSQEDIKKAAKDWEDGQSNALSIREATTVTRTQSSLTVGKEVTVSKAAKSGDAQAVTAPSTITFTGEMPNFPSAPLNGRPLNFGVVVPGIYRSSYPKPPDYEYIRDLKLKIVVTLVKKDEPDRELETFVTSNGIRQIIIDMKGTKKEAIPPKTIKAILSVVLNRQNHPLLIHCNHGKHRTGCIAAVVRKITGWDTKSVIDEYKSYASPKIRDCDVDFIKTFEVSSLQQQAIDEDGILAFSPVQIRTFFRALLFSAFVLVLWLVTGTNITPTGAEKRDESSFPATL